MGELGVVETTSNWRRLKALKQAAFPCRFAIGTWVAVSAALLFPAQSREALLVTSEEWPKILALLAATALWAHASWYFSRVMLRFVYPGYFTFQPESPEKQVWLTSITWFPRVLGVAAPATLALAVWLARPRDPWLVLSLIALAAVFMAIVWGRRRLFVRLGGEKRSALFGETRVPEPTPQDPGFANKWKQLPKWTRRAVLVQIPFLVSAIAIFTIWPVPAGQAMGSPAILVMAAFSWVCLGSLLTYVSNTMQLPVVRTLIVWAFLCSYCNDNHVVSPTLACTSASATKRPEVARDFATWSTSASPAQPWFFVVTEGGGIRAAYWTADVLAQLQDTFEDFNQHLYGISSVSGGSLGAAVYSTLVARGFRSGQFRAASTDILKVDSLAPVLAMGVYPNMLQQLSPVPVSCFDRGRALEESWSVAFASTVPAPNVFAGAFDDIWSREAATVRVPRLFLNSTWVETGQRAVISYPDASGAVVDSVDVESRLGRFTLAQSVHFSARFSYVSPAGYLFNGAGAWGHLVDGGYFDNSGAATAMDVIGQILKANPAASAPVIIAIRFVGPKPATREDSNQPPPVWLASDLVSPIDAVLNARVARGTQALASLERAFPSIEFLLSSPEGEDLPLGWMLSAKTRGSIDAALGYAENRRALDAVRQALTGGR